MAGLLNLFDKNHVGQVVEIAVEKIEPSRYQPRLHFDEDELRQLADSIRQHGLITPITVRAVADHYEIVAGERRLKAARLAGLRKLTCYILSPDENQAAQMALIENIQRADLSAVEEARGYVQIMRQAGLTQAQVAQKVGKSQSAVANKIRLLNLSAEVQQGVIEQNISERHARALLQLPPEKQTAVYRQFLKKKMNVRQAEAYVEKQCRAKTEKRRQKTRGFTRNIQIGINSLDKCVRMLQKMGIETEVETEDTPRETRVIIRFPK